MCENVYLCSEFLIYPFYGVGNNRLIFMSEKSSYFELVVFDRSSSSGRKEIQRIRFKNSLFINVFIEHIVKSCGWRYFVEVSYDNGLPF